MSQVLIYEGDNDYRFNDKKHECSSVRITIGNIAVYIRNHEDGSVYVNASAVESEDDPEAILAHFTVHQSDAVDYQSRYGEHQ
jgi:hypothetical protein